jgi:aerobic-type carbon monoxide dehydrogenase small subunit (CoxS/CutS family)
LGKYALRVNGEAHTIDGEAGMPLLWALRDRLGLTGTKYGCGAGICGACTVHEGARAVRACVVRLADAAGRSYTTIEGLDPTGDHPCPRAWLDEDVAQCGFCQPGMIMEAAALMAASRPARPPVSALEDALDTHVCRCGTHQRLRRAIRRLAGEAR